MKLNKNFLVHSTGKDTVVVPTGKAAFSGVVRGNETLGEILALLKKDTTKEEIVAALMEKYDVSREVIEADVTTVVDRLQAIGAIDA